MMRTVAILAALLLLATPVVAATPAPVTPAPGSILVMFATWDGMGIVPSAIPMLACVPVTP